MTTSPIYQPTLMQKLLGRNYKWWYVVVYNYKRANLNYFATFFFQSSLIINSLILGLLWFFINKEITVYILLAKLYFDFSKDQIYIKMGYDITSGQVTRELILPQNYLLLQLFDSIGSRVFRNLANFFSSLVVIGGFLTFGELPKFQQNWFLLIITLPLAFLINFLVGFVFGCLAFWLKDNRDFTGIKEAFETLSAIFRGMVVPLNFLPFLIPFQLLPLAFALFHPMQIYLGKYDANQTIWVFLGGIVWCVVLYFLAKLVFKLGLKRNESVGL